MLPALLASLAFAITYLLTPAVIKYANRFGVHADLNHRTVHRNITPKLGGLAIFVGVVPAMVLSSIWLGAGPEIAGLYVGATLVLLVGLIDDVRDLACNAKLTGQILAATLAVAIGFRLEAIALPGTQGVALGLWAWPVSILWIVAVTNAVNLLDGLDGLAAGFAMIASLGFALVAALHGDSALMTQALLLASATFGFWLFNRHPARVFLGDTGSLFLGFMLACLSIKALHTSAGDTALLSVLLVFLLPLADTLLSIVRRMSAGRHPFHADKKHIHHRLLAAGQPHGRAVKILLLTSMLLTLAGLAIFFMDFVPAVFVFSVVFLAFMLGLIRLRCFDFLARFKARSPGIEVHYRVKEPAANVTQVSQPVE